MPSRPVIVSAATMALRIKWCQSIFLAEIELTLYFSSFKRSLHSSRLGWLRGRPRPLLGLIQALEEIFHVLRVHMPTGNLSDPGEGEHFVPRVIEDLP